MEHQKAWQVVYIAVKEGKLPHVSTVSCQHCGIQAINYHHHKGYDPQYYLDVIPLCGRCHKFANKRKTTSIVTANEEIISYGFKAPIELMQQIKAKARAENVPLSVVLRRLLYRYVRGEVDLGL